MALNFISQRKALRFNPALFFAMKVTLNWLKQYVDFNWSPEELTGRLTMLGLGATT